MTLRDLEAGTAEWVHWYNTERPNGYINYLTPVRAERLHYDRQRAAETLLTVPDQLVGAPS